MFTFHVGYRIKEAMFDTSDQDDKYDWPWEKGTLLMETSLFILNTRTCYQFCYFSLCTK